MIKPYTEVILGTSTPPSNDSQVIVESWDDLVKASDTLGKPILRYRQPSDSAGRLFYVVDGPIEYVYLHPLNGRTEAESGYSASPSVPPLDDRPSAQGAASPAAGLAGRDLAASVVVERARALMLRLQAGDRTTDNAPEAARRLENALRLIKEGRLESADDELSAAERAMNG
jgi:hypothetical protein